jgi:HEAT repeat protein
VEALISVFALAAVAVPAAFYLLRTTGLIDWGARTRERLWREAARATGLSDVEESRTTFAGRAGPLRVQLSRYGSGEEYGTRITVSGPALPADLTVRPEGAATALQSLRGAREIEIGHDAFDSAAWVQGSPAVARAVLDGANRRALRALFEGRLERPRLSPFWATGRLDEGVLRVDVPEVVPPTRREGSDSRAQGAIPAVGRDYVGGLDRLPEVLEAVLALARRLETPEDLPRRLADNLKSEAVAGVRAMCLTTLAREFPHHAATREALLAARVDPDAEVRLRSAIVLGAEGHDVLLAVASGEGAEDATTERAVVALGPHLTTAEARGILKDALRTRREATARACLLALGHRREPEAVSMLAKVLAVETPELAAAAADALGATGDPSAEPALLAALGRPHPPVRAAAARALGRVGTTAAVLALKEAEAGNGAVRAAARQAIAEIQSRAKGAAPGQLSLAGGESGRLSLAGGEPGRLSLASGEEGQLSLASRGASSVSGDEGSATSADPSGPGTRSPSG